MRRTSIFAGHTLLLGKSGVLFKIEDWAENVLGETWMVRLSVPASFQYAKRVVASDLTTDGDVVYGKVDGFGTLVHVTELEFPDRDSVFGPSGLPQALSDA